MIETSSLVRLAAAWAGYGALHSAMISRSVTRSLSARLGDAWRFYRLFFNGVALATLVPLVLYSRSLVGPPFFRWQGLLLGVRYGLIACGGLLFIAGGRHYSLRQFIGISQLRGARSGGLTHGGGIDSTGVLGVVRHPWYSGLVLLLWAQDLDAVRVVTSAVLTAYVVVGTFLEERKLVDEFGETYARYQAQVSMFVPLKWLRARAGRLRPAVSRS
jgi:protein-S-isoprenylcysteine O-methyltransferase Ste14